MIRLNVVAEGQTEQGFVDSVLKGHLANFGVIVSARCVETSTNNRTGKTYRGGLVNYERARNDLGHWRLEDNNSDARFTTMFDLFRLPDDFPKFEEAQRLTDPYDCVKRLEEGLAEDIEDRRLIPYIQLHEFEALLFADPAKLDWEYLEHDKQIAKLVKVANEFDSPELINQGAETAPSKRIIAQIPEYEHQKASVGPMVAEKIGLDEMRKKCPHFREWIGRLEALGTDT